MYETEPDTGDYATNHTIDQGVPHLAVTNLGIPVCISCQHSPQGGDSRVILEGRVLWQGAM